MNPYYSGLTGPIMPFTSNSDVTVDYYYINTGVDGLLGRYWSSPACKH